MTKEDKLTLLRMDLNAVVKVLDRYLDAHTQIPNDMVLIDLLDRLLDAQTLAEELAA